MGGNQTEPPTRYMGSGMEQARWLVSTKRSMAGAAPPSATSWVPLSCRCAASAKADGTRHGARLRLAGSGLGLGLGLGSGLGLGLGLG